MIRHPERRRRILAVILAALSVSAVGSCARPGPVTSPQESHGTAIVPEIHWSAGDPRDTTDELAKLIFDYQILTAAANNTNNYSNPDLKEIVPNEWLENLARAFRIRSIYAGPLPLIVLESRIERDGNHATVTACKLDSTSWVMRSADEELIDPSTTFAFANVWEYSVEREQGGDWKLTDIERGAYDGSGNCDVSDASIGLFQPNPYETYGGTSGAIGPDGQRIGYE